MGNTGSGAKTPTKGRPLVIVESPAKARTIAKFLGKDWMVEASIGHVRDLPSSAAEIPASVKGEPWARLGVNVDQDYEPLYVVPSDKKARIRELKARLKEASVLYLATDEDREGESISWHLLDLLKPKVPVKRMVFHEITKAAINEAIENCRELDEHLVDAQESRRILDRLYGYEVSPILWRKIAPRLSAGRVQSVTTRLIVERERERMAFRAASWWDARVVLDHEGRRFPAQVVGVDGAALATGRDFTTEGSLGPGRKSLVLDEGAARKLAAGLSGARAVVRSVDEKEFSSAPKPPFTTSTLQQEAGRKLGMSARRAMQAAQRLYEGGYITYMRTDSVKLSTQAVDAARSLVAERYGPEYLPPAPRAWEAKSRNAQEAHEAIRPAGEVFRAPEELSGELDSSDARLYDLIWKRTVASQMLDARHKSVTASFDCPLSEGGKQAELQARGRVVLFDGFLRAYVEGSDEGSEGAEADEGEERESILPPLRAGHEARVAEALPVGHETKPPARYTEAGIVQKLEELGIGRPSTYASIIGTIIEREYVAKRGSALVPTPLAFAVVQLMLELEPTLVDYSFTADMESRLDSIALGELGRRAFLDDFYRGKLPGLHAIVTDRATRIDPKRVGTIPIGEHEGVAISLRVGRYGPYIERGDERASMPEGLAPDEITVDKALELLSAAGQAELPIGQAPDGTPVYLRTGRFGPYVQLGEDQGDKKHKPRRASLFKSMDPRRVSLEEALLLLSLPRKLGLAPDGGDIIARPGRFGPYLEKTIAGAEKPETRSLKSEEEILTITLAGALALFAIPKRGRARTVAAPLRELGLDPASSAPILLRDGAYGPYVTDGTTNASLPKGAGIDELTLADALRLIADRREAGPAKGKRKGGRRAATSPSSSGAAKSKAARAVANKSAAPDRDAATESASKPAPKKTATPAGAAAKKAPIRPAKEKAAGKSAKPKPAAKAKAPIKAKAAPAQKAQARNAKARVVVPEPAPVKPGPPKAILIKKGSFKP